ncbi:hypothetical protein M5K25_024220 [Dendrobium thyrsiflorum]|uniref:Uncharacterized protein n=1 Tax=Dendrobium thyrsiflorum TaxID=117978 RepID=A0ABD0U1F7_DENTH
MQKRLEWSREAFDVGERRWRAMEEEAVQKEEFSKTCVIGGHGQIYNCGVGGKILLVKEGEEWREVAELPEEVRGSDLVKAERLCCFNVVLILHFDFVMRL